MIRVLVQPRILVDRRLVPGVVRGSFGRVHVFLCTGITATRGRHCGSSIALGVRGGIRRG